MSRFKPNDNPNAVLERPSMPKSKGLSGVGWSGLKVSAVPATTTETATVEKSIPDTGNALVALYTALAFMFFRFSFLHEMLMTKIGFDTHLLLILGIAAVIAALASGGLFNGISNRIALAWFGFALWMVLASVWSFWRGGSLAVLIPYLRTTMILVVLVPAVATSAQSVSKVLKTVGYAGLAVVVLGFTSNDFRSGRLELSAGTSSIANSNDYAALLILLMPAMAYLTMRRDTAIAFKIVGVVALVLACFLVLSTGSRGALISMILSTLYILKVGSGKVRVAILAGVPLAALIAIPFLPGEASGRLASLFSSSEHRDSEAASSQLQRTALLMESLRFTKDHPLLGLGPGTFAIYQAQDAQNHGQRGMWHETHNSYTQVSSECGVPALLFYLAAIGMSFVVFRRARKSEDPEIRSLSSILGLMLVSFCICMFFLSQAYGFGFPVLGGFAISLDRLLKREQSQIALAKPLAA